MFMCRLGPPPAPSRGLHKYYEDDVIVVDYTAADLKGDSADQRRPSYRSAAADSPPAPSSHGCRNGRYVSPGGSHDDVFVDRHELKSQQLDWDSNSHSGRKSSEDVLASHGRAQHTYSPPDSERSRGGARSRTSQSISPVHRRFSSNDHKMVSPPSHYVHRHDDHPGRRRNSLEPSDHDHYQARCSSDVGRSCTRASGDCVKSRTVANDIGAVSDRDRLLRTCDVGSLRNSTASTDSNRPPPRHSDKEFARSYNVRSVVNTTPSWQFDSDYKHASQGSDSSVVDSNHIGLTLHKLRSETIEVGSSDSASPQSKSPRVVSDAEESSTPQPERPASKGSDDMLHLEKEKSHLLNMLKELEDYSSGGSEIEGLNEEGRAVLRHLHRQQCDAGDDDDALNADDKLGASGDGAGDITITPVRVPHRDISSKSSGESRSCPTDKPDGQRFSESLLRSSTNSDAKKRRVSLENHVPTVIASSLEAEDDVIDLIGSSPPSEIPADFTRRQRAFSDITTVASGDCGVKSRRSYRPRESADSADSSTEDALSNTAGKVTTPRQSVGHATTTTANRSEAASVSCSAASTHVHRSHSLEDVRRSSTSGQTRKGSGSDHQPCIIPDSPVTTRGPDIRPPTEPRTVSSTTTPGGRIIMDLPLPKFGFDKRLRHPSTTSGEHATSMASAPTKVESAVAHSTVGSAVTLKTDVAPFSPGLLSPALSPSVVKPEMVTTTNAATPAVATPAVATPAHTFCMVTSEVMSSEQEVRLSAAAHADTALANTSLLDVSTAGKATEKNEAALSDVTPESEVKNAESRLESEAEVLNGATGKDVAPVTVKEEASLAVCDSDVSDLLSPGSPPDTLSLEDRIKALDEKLNQMQKTTQRHLSSSDAAGLASFDYTRFIRRRKQPMVATSAAVTESTATTEPSDYVKSLLSRSSIFDQDIQRLEQLQSKCDPFGLSSTASVDDSAPGSSLVSRLRFAGRLPSHDLTLQLPLPSTSFPCSSSSATVHRSSDLAMSLSSPVGSSSYSGLGGSALLTSPAPSWCISSVTVTTPGSLWSSSSSTPVGGWSSAWASPASVAVSTAGAPDAVRLATSFQSHGMVPQTPGQVTSSVPADPRRRSVEMFPSTLAAVRRQESGHSDSTLPDTWAPTGSARREPDVSIAPSKPKEMVSPPVSILKKTVSCSVTKDDVAVNNSRSGDSSQLEVSSPGVKRSADTAFGKEATSSTSTPNKVIARTPKAVSQPALSSEAESHSSRSSESDHLKTQASNVLKWPESAKKQLPSKLLTAKVEHGTSGTTLSGRKMTADDLSKSGCSTKIQSKPHSIPSTPVSSSVSSISKSHAHKDLKPTNTESSRHTSVPKESSTAENDFAEKPSSSHTSSSSGKPKTVHTMSKESASKDRTGDDRDKLLTPDEKDSAPGKEKSTSSISSHSKHHQVEHRHSDKLPRDCKLDDVASRTSKVAIPSLTVKTGPKTTTRDPTKSDRSDKAFLSKPKPEVSGSMKKDSSEAVKKDGSGIQKQALTMNKSDREHKASEKESSNREKMSNAAKPPKKRSADTVATNKMGSSSVAKPLSSCNATTKPNKHAEKSSGDRKKQEVSAGDRTKKLQSSAVEKNKSIKKKLEKRPEEKREVRRIMCRIDVTRKHNVCCCEMWF